MGSRLIQSQLWKQIYPVHASAVGKIKKESETQRQLMPLPGHTAQPARTKSILVSFKNCLGASFPPILSLLGREDRTEMIHPSPRPREFDLSKATPIPDSNSNPGSQPRPCSSPGSSTGGTLLTGKKKTSRESSSPPLRPRDALSKAEKGTEFSH